jgi:hypothetical protein
MLKKPKPSLRRLKRSESSVCVPVLIYRTRGLRLLTARTLRMTPKPRAASNGLVQTQQCPANPISKKIPPLC